MRSTTRRPLPTTARLLLAVAAGLVLAGCLFEQPRETAGGRLAVGFELEVEATRSGIAYGPDPAQTLEVYAAPDRSVGTIVYFHSGGWVGGDQTKVAAVVGSALDRGWSIVSVGYRLAPGHRAPELLADADRALRFVRARADSLGVDVSALVVAGGSAGGHLAAMLAAAPGRFAAPDLPPELGTVDPVPDGLIALVAPTDLTTLWKAGGWAPAAEASLLGCSASGAPVTTKVEVVLPCTDDSAERYSPLHWAQEAGRGGRSLPPGYFAYGGLDGLVEPETQGAPIAAVWAEVAGYSRAWYDLAAASGHNVDHDVTTSSLDRWLDKVAADDW